MAYPNYYNPYQTNIPAPMDRLAQLQQPYQIQPQASNGILWVQGEAAAKAYLVAPGTSVLLMDSDSNSFYIKTVDQAGMPQPLRVFKYTEVQNTCQEPQGATKEDVGGKYVTREEYDELAQKYDEIIARLESLAEAAEPATKKPEPKTTRNKGGTENE